MFRVTSEPSTVLRILQNRTLVNADRAKIISCCNECSITGRVRGIHISAVRSLREHARDLPSELASGRSPYVQGRQRHLSLGNLLHLFDIIKKFGVGLVDGAEVLGVLGPVHGGDCGGVDECDGPVQIVLALFVDLVNVDGVVVGANGEELLVRRVDHDLAPLSRLVQSGDPSSEIVVV